MKTDYKRMTGFDTALIVAAVFGLSIISFEIYVSLPNGGQDALKKSVAIFNLQEGIETQIMHFQDALSVMDEFYQEFDLAFSQTLSVDQELQHYFDQIQFTFVEAKTMAREMLDISPQKTMAYDFLPSVLGINTSSVGCGEVYPKPVEPQQTTSEILHQQLEQLKPFGSLLLLNN